VASSLDLYDVPKRLSADFNNLKIMSSDIENGKTTVIEEDEEVVDVHVNVPGGDGGGEEVDKDGNVDGEDGDKDKSLLELIKDNWQIGVKILEIVISCLCLGFFFEPAQVTGLGKSELHHVGLVYTAFSFIFINMVLLLGKILGESFPFKTSTILSASGSALYLISGILLVVDRSDLMKRYIFHPHGYLMVMLTTATFFAFLNSLVFALDAILGYKRKENF